MLGSFPLELFLLVRVTGVVTSRAAQENLAGVLGVSEDWTHLACQMSTRISRIDSQVLTSITPMSMSCEEGGQLRFGQRGERRTHKEESKLVLGHVLTDGVSSVVVVRSLGDLGGHCAILHQLQASSLARKKRSQTQVWFLIFASSTGEHSKIVTPFS